MIDLGIRFFQNRLTNPKKNDYLSHQALEFVVILIWGGSGGSSVAYNSWLVVAQEEKWVYLQDTLIPKWELEWGEQVRSMNERMDIWPSYGREYL